jgi:hypothetical protein
VALVGPGVDVIDPIIEIRALPPDLQAVALARVRHEMALDRKALGLPPVAEPDPERLWCGCPVSELRETNGVRWCNRCSP